MYKKLISEWANKGTLTQADKLGILETVMEVFPLIVLANLSTNEYVLLKDDGFLHARLAASGCYDAMIDDGVENIHPNYQEAFVEAFDRKNLIRAFDSGKKEVCTELYQKKYGDDGYQWVSTHVIRLDDPSGDYIQICLNRVINDNVIRKTSRK